MQSAVYPEYPFSPAEMRHDDSTYDTWKYFRWRVVIDGIGWAQLNHSLSAYRPDTYWLDLGVVPDARRRGHGTRLYDAALAVAGAREAKVLRTGVKESMADGVGFAVRRGWVESKRDWESRLFLRDFDFGRFAGARERIEGQGIRISTLRDELARDPSAAAKEAFELVDEVHNDVPSTDPRTPLEKPTWRRRTLEGPNALPEAFFIAVDRDGRYLALSELERSEDPTFLWQGLTGVRREARGRGLAMALKLETVRFARERGIDHIKTWNDQRNRPMLRINEALGFVKQPAWIELQKDL